MNTKTDNIVLYCKSFNRDVDRCKILLESIIKYNKDNIPFYISVPSQDVKLFENTLGTSNYILLKDEDILGIKLSESWKNQQVVKMLFWNTGLSDNHLVLDSDAYFIKDFYKKDFLMNEEKSIPYTVMHEQKELFGWTSLYKNILGFDPQQSFAECRTPIQELFDRKGRLYDFGPVPCIWNSNIWKSMKEEYLIPNNLTFENLITTISSEFSWYGEWLLTHQNIIPLWPIEPIFKVFHYKQQYEQYKIMVYTEENWSQNYLGLVMQSNAGLPSKY